MEFVFDEEKATQAASVLLLEQLHGTMPCTKLVQVLYLADRQSLVETGMPITGDRFVSLKDGPALGRVLGLVRESNIVDGSPWHRHIRCVGRNSVLDAPAGSDRLSRYESRILTALSDAHGRAHEDTVTTHVQRLPEWTAPAGKSVGTEIAPEDILRAAGRTDDEIEETAQHAAEAWFLQTLTSLDE